MEEVGGDEIVTRHVPCLDPRWEYDPERLLIRCKCCGEKMTLDFLGVFVGLFDTKAGHQPISIVRKTKKVGGK